MTLTVNHPSARRAWSMDLASTTPQFSFFYQNGLVKPKKQAQSAIMVEMDELTSFGQGGTKSGYRIDYDLQGPVTGVLTPGDKPIVDKASRIALFTDSVEINLARKSVEDDGSFAEGLVPYEFRERARDRLAEYWARVFDEHTIAKLSGAVGDGAWTTFDPTKATTGARDIEGSVAFDGNDLRAPSANRILYGENKANQGSITSNDKLSLNVIDMAILQAIRTDPNSVLLRLVNPIIEAGKKCFVFLCDYTTAIHLTQDTSGRYFTVAQAMAQGGFKDSQLIRGALGVYKSPLGVDVILMSHPRLVKFSSATTGGVKVVRNLLLGQSAGRIAYGKGSKMLPSYNWHEETDNRGNTLVITTGNIFGVQKCAYSTTETGSTREDWGVIAVDTYADW